MKSLMELNIDNLEICSIKGINASFDMLSEDDIKEYIDTMHEIGCEYGTIKNIILSNPLSLNKTRDEILEVVNKLISWGIRDMDMFLDTNPRVFNVYNLTSDYLNTIY